MFNEKTLAHVLQDGPYKGQTILQATGLTPEQLEKKKAGYLYFSKGIDWMGWYLSHHCSWNKLETVPPDRQAISDFLINLKDCYNVEPYRTWSKE